MKNLTFDEKKKLKAMAHHMKPMIQVGHKGISDNLITAIDEAIESRELVKIKFIGSKELKHELSEEIAERSSSALVGLIGNTAILYREKGTAAE